MSKTVISLIVALLGLIMQWVGIPLTDEEALPIAEKIAQALGLLLTVGGMIKVYLERKKRGDITTLGLRKGPEGPVNLFETPGRRAG